MYPNSQNILLIYPHFGIAFLEPPHFLNSEDSETVRRDHFSSLPFLSMVHHSDYQQGNIFHRYTLNFIFTRRFETYRDNFAI